ncbi:MAG: helix-turn-helix domain-containing protein [Blastocatellia bacterium]
MPSLGQELKRAREERSIALHDIANSTHIGVRFLQAIEGDDYSILPGGVFNRAFVRKFAKQVGYDEEQAVKLYEAQLEVQGIEPQKRYELGVEDFEGKSSSGNGLLFSLLALILLIAGAYVAYVLLNPPTPESKLNPAAVASPTPTPTATPEPSVAAAVSPEASPGTGPTLAPLPPGAIRMQLIASGGQCWISLKTDNAPEEQILLNDGDNREFAVNERVIFNSLGNYPAIRISINGRQLNSAKLFPDQKGVVAKNVIITKDNFQQFLD